MASSNGNIVKYRTFDQLMSAVLDDLPVLDDNNLVDSSNLIKVVRKINKELSLRVNKTKEVIVECHNGVVDLPNDLEAVNFAVLCTFHKNVVPQIQGVQTEYVEVDCSGGCTNVWITECGDTFQIINKIHDQLEQVFNIQTMIKFVDSTWSFKKDKVYGVVLNDNFMKLNVSTGKVYLNYQGILENEDGSLLVVDHPVINEYYEYALKERILENLYLRGEDVERKLSYISLKRRNARIEANNIAKFLEYYEIQDVREMNRKAMFEKFFSIFI